mgnify:CR=1 FL=1
MREKTKFMNNPFSQRISDVIQFSKEEANRLRNNYIGPEHLLLGLIREGEGKAVQILKDLYVDLEMVKKTLENDLRSSAVTPENYSEDITFDEKASKILKMSILESRILKSPGTDTEHMLLAIMRENQNKASQILEENEVTYQKVMDKLVPKAEPQSGLDFGEDEEEEEEGIRRQPTGNGESSFFSQEAKQTTRTQQQKPNNDTPVLDSFGTDMTKAASEGKLDPIVGREKEIERLVAQMNAEYGAGTATLELRDQYYNMREKIEPVMHIIDTAFAAMEAVGVKPNVKPIRGGTDGAQLSFKGLPCPNIFAGGLNFHGRYEFVPIQNMEKAMKVIVKIAELVASK